MNFVKYKRNFIFFICDIIFILNIENNIYSIFLFVLQIKYKYNITQHIYGICYLRI